MILLLLFMSFFISGVILPQPAPAEDMPYLGEIEIFSFNFAPRGWAQCNGQLLPINQNQALFSVLGTTYGGDGITTFALPDLRGRLVIHYGYVDGYSLGEKAGEESHTLTSAEMPTAVHAFATNSPGTLSIPGPDTILAGAQALDRRDVKIYAPADYSPGMFSSMIGGSQPHDNMQPYLVLNYCIALQGIFPSQN
jgi:microcystin-dependent protein